MEILVMCNLSTSSSKELRFFILRLFRFIAVQVLVLAVFFVIGYKIVSEKTIYSSIIMKHNLLRETDSPRILLAGASGTLFGYNSSLLHELTGYPVINMSITLQTGLSFIVNELRYYAMKEDIIILAPEYHFFMKNQTDYRFLAELCMYDPVSIALIEQPYKIVKPALLEISRVIRIGSGDILNTESNSVPYTRRDVTRFGDIADSCHIGSVEFYDSWSNDLDIEIGYPSYAFHLITEIAGYCDSIGAKLYIFYPAVTDSFYVKPEITRLAASMSGNINACFLCGPETCVYDDTKFYNTIYHLNTEAAICRTYQLYSLIYEGL